MKNIIISCIFISVISQNAFSQLTSSGHFYGEDAIKFYNYGIIGSAKVTGMGGAYTALGGDMTNAIINPAGLAFYNKSEFSFSPIFSNSKTNSIYADTKTSLSSSDLNIGQIGAVFSNNGTGSRKKRTAWGITYNSLARFNNDYNYNGINNRSSITDYFADKANARGANSTVLNEEFNTETGLAQTTTALYYQAFLIDVNNNTYVPSELSVPVKQSGRVTETGSLGQFNISYAANFDDRTYLGGSIGIQNLNYGLLTEHNEVFPNANVIDNLKYTDDLFVKGTGVNVNLGGIFKASENLRIGVSLTSPTAMKVDETIVTTISIKQLPNTFKTDYPTISTVPNDFTYRITSPLRANFGGAYFLPSKLGVINIDAEYVGYSMMNIKDKEDARWSSDQKRGVQNEYKDVVNFKAGTEIRAGLARIRAGVNYIGDPRKNPSEYNSSSTIVGSAGLGIRNTKFFGDVSYSRSMRKSSFTPYTLPIASDYSSASVNTSTGMLVISVGTYF